MASFDTSGFSEQPKEDSDNMDRLGIIHKNALQYTALVIVPILLFVSANYFVDYVLVDTPGRIENLQREMSERMDSFDSRMGGFDSQLSTMNTRLDTLDNNMSRMESRLNDKIDREIDGVKTELVELKELLVNAIESSALRVDSSE